jgi:hypothetical protein
MDTITFATAGPRYLDPKLGDRTVAGAPRAATSCTGTC